MVLCKKDAFHKIGNQVWYCQSIKAKVTLWSVDLTEVVPEQRPLNGWVCNYAGSESRLAVPSSGLTLLVRHLERHPPSSKQPAPIK